MTPFSELGLGSHTESGRRQSAECNPDTIQKVRVTLRRNINTEFCIVTALTIQLGQVKCKADTVQNVSVQCQPGQKIILRIKDYVDVYLIKLAEIKRLNEEAM